ncbi:MAG: hypothetical protein AAF492_22635, partial [Verrucomicrobiota bacterium]
ATVILVGTTQRFLLAIDSLEEGSGFTRDDKILPSDESAAYDEGSYEKADAPFDRAFHRPEDHEENDEDADPEDGTAGEEAVDGVTKKRGR